MIFERLNTGGKKLVPQEIRACIYHGSFNQMLNKLSNDHIWKEIYSADNKRLKSEELILRFFALRDEWNEYTKGLKSFLNRYMEKNRNIDDETQEKYSEIFCKSIRFVYDTIGPTAFRIGKNLNAAIFDSVLVATSYLLDVKDSPETSVFKDGYEQLLKDTEYRKYVESSTSSELSIKKRISLAKKFLCENG
jgi:hypothetical protein